MPSERQNHPEVIARAVNRTVDALEAAEKAGSGTVTLSAADLKLVMRMFSTLYRNEVARVSASR